MQKKEGTRYFVLKSNGFESLHLSRKEGIWATPLRKNPPQPHQLLNEAFQSSERVLLVLSVNKTKSWKGFAVMTSAAADTQETFLGEANKVDARERLSEPFGVKWLCSFPQLKQQGLPFAATQHLINPLAVARRGGEAAEEALVNQSRNCQELSAEVGEALCKLIEEAVSAEHNRMEELARLQEEKVARSHFFLASGESDVEQNWTGFLEEVSKLGRVLFACHLGSRSYNLHHQGSDADMLAIVAAPLADVLCTFDPPKATVKNATGFEPDFTVHEVGYFCELLAGGDTRMLETLFQSRRHSVVFESTEWRELRDQRMKLFLPHASEPSSPSPLLSSSALRFLKNVLEKYLSEVEGAKGIPAIKKLFQKVEEEERELATQQTSENNNVYYDKRKQQKKKKVTMELVHKKWYINFRLLMQAKRLVEGRKLNLWLKERSPEREFLLSIRQGQYSHEQLLQRAEAELTEIRKFARNRGILPQEGEEQREQQQQSTLAASDVALFLKDWLLKHRLEEVHHNYNAAATTTKEDKERATRANEHLQSLFPELQADNLDLLFLVKRWEEQETVYTGVYVADPMQVLSAPIDRVVSAPQNEDATLTFSAFSTPSSSPASCTLYELSKFCSMLMQGNPNSLELLFFPPNQKDKQEQAYHCLLETSPWIALKSSRDKLLTQQAVSRSIGLLQGQLKRITTKTLTASFFRVYSFLCLCRDVLLSGAERVAEGEEAQEEEELRKYHKLVEWFQRHQKEREQALPKSADINVLRRWCSSIRLDRLRLH
ncbi:YTH domain-containing protein [Balamuthia mandrillaris]